MKALHFFPLLRLTLLLLLGSLLCACRHSPVAGLPDAQALQEKRVLTQQLEARWQDYSGSLLTILQSGDGEIDFLATTLLGQEVFHLHYDGVKPVLLSRSAALPRSFRADYLLRDLLWAQWPAASLQPGLAQAGLALTENGNSREIHALPEKGGQVKLVIQHSGPGIFHIENPRLRYALDLSPADDSNSRDAGSSTADEKKAGTP